jgi:hypothetical protein
MAVFGVYARFVLTGGAKKREVLKGMVKKAGRLKTADM